MILHGVESWRRGGSAMSIAQREVFEAQASWLLGLGWIFRKLGRGLLF